MELIINETDGRCAIGALVMENLESGSPDALNDMRSSLEGGIREKYANTTRAEFKALHPIDSYVKYYKKFGYSYHVLAQLESIVKGKGIPAVYPLVEAMFMAELKNALLTAGHDLDKLELPIRAQICNGEESFIAMGQRDSQMIKDDVMLSDAKAPISSILRGPDARTAISKGSKRVLYIVYAPEGVENERVIAHLDDIENYVRSFSPNAATSEKRVF